MPFIVGVARSGTTLLRLMLDAGPDISIPPETYFLLPFFRSPRPLSEIDGEEFTLTVTGFHPFADLGIAAASLHEAIARIRPFDLAEAARTVYRLYAERHGKCRIGDKTPAYGRWMERIEAVLPEARFIHVIRDGRDVALSLRQQWFAPSQEMSGLARHWADEVRAIEAVGSRCRHVRVVRFEELVRDPRTTLQGLCAWLSLPYDAAMLGFHRTAADRLGEVGDQRMPDGRVVTRESRLARHSLASSPPDESRAGAWRTTLSEAERRDFESVAGDLLAELGY